MKVRFTTHVIGGYTPGQVAEFSEAQASAYFVAGVAVPVEDGQHIETATALKPQLQTAEVKVTPAPKPQQQPQQPKAEAK
jgi:hypothetical protein